MLYYTCLINIVFCKLKCNMAINHPNRLFWATPFHSSKQYFSFLCVIVILWDIMLYLKGYIPNKMFDPTNFYYSNPLVIFSSILGMRFHNLGCYVCFIKYKSCLFAPEFYDAINFANIVTL